ncbi:homoserine kinase [Blochmannia endosymbiont of Camponotus sp. C-003]|uniref:homoserine kinase n=1 Tax=unclassified Candidatus Blochmanniella TaxID=711328 RepID=UPI00202540DA|nr:MULTISPECIES: homoserine kinase [unclassified Candidatus Blochmannia]URJ23125.1 homoserine kinase [Blochmannia endosymbiont of Camponotus sp. C-003]URJ28594.1 homoserine kinase [Blochmannia endosymbiont of Camponotus sp. C-046]
MTRVYAPASIGNIGVGFDTLGMAISPINGSLLGDCISIENANTFSLQNTGCFHHQLPAQLEENIVFQCWKKFCEILGQTYCLNITLEKNVPVSSGLGSSACSIVAVLVAMNYHCGCPLNTDQLLALMGEMEGKVSGSMHFDNVSPCFLGSMRLILKNCNAVSQKIPIFDDWLWIIAYPGIKISTATSRSVLPNKYDREDCINHSQYLSGFIHACHTNQEDLAIKCMKDIIAEPYRSQLFPMELSYMRHNVMKKGAISCGISGSGPTVFALCNNHDVIEDISDWLSRFYLQNNSGFVQICFVDKLGARIMVNNE